MISNIYYRKKLGIPFVTIIIFITCCIVTLSTYLDNNLYYIFASRSKPIYWWQTFSGSFEHTIFNNPPLLVHFISNMFFLCTLGVMCERLLGSFKMFILVVSGIVVPTFCLYHTSSGEGVSTSAGASGIVYIFPPIVLYVLIILWNQYKDELKKEKMLYVISFIFVFMYVFISIVSPISTNSVHGLSTMIGGGYLIVWHKEIKKRVLNTVDVDKPNVVKISIRNKMAIVLSLGLLGLMLAILIINYATGYEKLYFKISDGKTQYTVGEINANQNRIVIYFSEPINDYVNMKSNIYSEEPLSFDTNVAKDGLSCEIIFNRTLKDGQDYGSFLLDKNFSRAGKVLQVTDIMFD